MKIAALAALLLAAPWVASAAESPRICGWESGQSLSTFNDAKDAFQQAGGSPWLTTGLTELGSMPDIRAFVASERPERVCVTGVATSGNVVSKDILVVLSMERAGKSTILPLAFKVGTVQQYETFGAKPWVGFPRADFAALVRAAWPDDRAFQERALNRDEEFSPLDAFSALPGPVVNPMEGRPAPAVPNSKGFLLVPDFDAHWTTYIVSQLRDQRAAYSGEFGVVQVRRETNGAIRVRWAPARALSEAVGRMAALQEQSAPHPPSVPAGASAEQIRELQLRFDEARLAQLKKISE